MTLQNIQGEMCEPDGLDLVNLILRGPYNKFSAQGPEFLATDLHTVVEVCIRTQKTNSLLISSRFSYGVLSFSIYA